MQFLRLLAVLSILLPSHLAAQEKVGSSQVDGKTVDLFSDKTWRYRSEDTACLTIKVGIDFCGVKKGWQKSMSSHSDISAQFRYDDRHYGVLIVEELGTKDGISLEFMKSAVVENFAGFTGEAADDVPVLEVEDGLTKGLPSSLVVYAGKMNDVPIVYANTLVVQSFRNTQIATYSIGESFSERHRRLHDEFVAAVRIKR